MIRNTFYSIINSIHTCIACKWGTTTFCEPNIEYKWLGPFLFLVFINDLSQAISDGYNNIFADDACLYTIGKSVSEVQLSLQKCVTNADEWYVSNLLSINTTKSSVILVGSQQAIHTNTSEFAIYLNNERLEEVTSARYLGLEIDSLLKCDVHVKMLSRIISINLATLSRSRYFTESE